MFRATFVGSLQALRSPEISDEVAASRICVVATAAAFRGPDDAIAEVLGEPVWGDATTFSVAAIDRRGANDGAVVDEVAHADLVILVDGAVLHARSVWRASALGAVLATSRLVAIGSIGSVLGATMIDPRGGAPTTGMGLFDEVVLSVPAGKEQTLRTQGLLADTHTLVELGARSILTYEGAWIVRVDEDLVVTRGGVATVL